jgi:orotate phosphoribosyltransferase
MDLNKESALKVAEFLLQIKAVRLQPNQPFTWASGWKSPIYCDNRLTLSYPNIRTYIRQQMATQITELFGKPDIIVGVATGGIPQGVLVAQDLGVGFAYIRAEAKGHGTGKRVEGLLEEQQNAVVIEDLVSTGGSSLSAVRALKDQKVKVKGLISVFTYGFDVAKKAFEDEKVPQAALCDYDTLIEQALKSEYIVDKDLETLQAWRKDPANWGQS